MTTGRSASSLTKTALMALATSTARQCVERTIHCSDGITIAARCWGGSSSAPLASATTSVAAPVAAAAAAAATTGTATQHQPIRSVTTSSSESSNSPAARSSNISTARPSRKILCLHGWLDNSASFDLLAPALSAHFSAQQNQLPTEIVALDLPGHGRSSHKSSDGPPQLLAEYVYYVSESIDALGWNKEDKNKNDNHDSTTNSNKDDELILVGHSMGAGIATTFCAAFPERVGRVVLLEGAGPLARNSADVGRHVRDAVVRRRRGNGLLYGNVNGIGGDTDGMMNGEKKKGDNNNKVKKGGARVYPSLDAAVDVRMSTAKLSPGRQYISREAAKAMVRRATVPAPQASNSDEGSSIDGGGGGGGGGNLGNGGGSSGSTNSSGGPVIFRHDPRLQWPSLQYFTREQVDSLYKEVQCPVCLLSAEDGWPFDARAQRSVEELLRPKYHRVLRGSHHFHADPDTAGRVVEEVLNFLEKEGKEGAVVLPASD